MLMCLVHDQGSGAHLPLVERKSFHLNLKKDEWEPRETSRKEVLPSRLADYGSKKRSSCKMVDHAVLVGAGRVW